MQKTFFIIKPDAVKRHLMGQVIDRIERRGFIIERMEMLTLDEERLKDIMLNWLINLFSLAL